jgi:hypothetical protein
MEKIHNDIKDLKKILELYLYGGHNRYYTFGSSPRQECSGLVQHNGKDV